MGKIGTIEYDKEYIKKNLDELKSERPDVFDFFEAFKAQCPLSTKEEEILIFKSFIFHKAVDCLIVLYLVDEFEKDLSNITIQ